MPLEIYSPRAYSTDSPHPPFSHLSVPRPLSYPAPYSHHAPSTPRPLHAPSSPGYITERSLYQYNLIMPNMRRRLFYEDLSHMPQPYRLMRNMLMMPGSLSGYTFYRAPTSDFGKITGTGLEFLFNSDK